MIFKTAFNIPIIRKKKYPKRYKGNEEKWPVGNDIECVVQTIPT